MPLTTDTWTVQEAIDELERRVAELEAQLDELDDSTDRYAALKAQRDELQYRSDGLVWMRDNAEWGGDTELELGAPTAGEKAEMYEEAADNAGAYRMKIWFVAAGTVAAPYYHDRDESDRQDVAATFRELAATAHDGYVAWAEGKLNTLSTPGNTTRASRTSSSATPAAESSTSDSTSTT